MPPDFSQRPKQKTERDVCRQMRGTGIPFKLRLAIRSPKGEGWWKWGEKNYRPRK